MPLSTGEFTLEDQSEDLIMSNRSLILSKPGCSLVWVPRKQNRLAHKIAKWAASTCQFDRLLLNAIPPSVLNCVLMYYSLILNDMFRSWLRKKKTILEKCGLLPCQTKFIELNRVRLQGHIAVEVISPYLGIFWIRPTKTKYRPPHMEKLT